MIIKVSLYCRRDFFLLLSRKLLEAVAVKKFLLMCLAILLSLQGAASAKDLPEAERIKVAVEVSDTSNHQELDTATNLEKFLGDKLVEKNLVNVVGTENFPVEVAAEKKSPEEIFGELLIFDVVELPTPAETPEEFDQALYKNLGADYVIRCKVLALGLTKVEDKTMSTIIGATGAITSLIGSGNKSRDKTLRRVGFGIGLGGFIHSERTALTNVVNMQFISVETGEILWQGNFVGQGIRPHSVSKPYSDVWEQAYFKSIEKTAKLISKRVNKYVDKVIIKGESDKEFTSKKFAIGNERKKLI